MRQFNLNYMLGDTETGQSAAGTTQATATALTADHSWIATCANNAGVILTERPLRSIMSVTNATTNNLNVYPWVGASLNGATANLPLTLSPNMSGWFFVVSQTKVSANF